MRARLTDVKARNAQATLKPFKLADGGGLFLLVQPNGKKFWRYKYRIAGKENCFALGEYPTVTLQQAREAHGFARKLVANGVHPSHQRRADRLVTIGSASNTFRAVACEWIDQNRSAWSPYYLNQVETVMRSDVFPHIGGIPIRSVTAAQLLTIVRRVANRPAPTVAILIRQLTSAIFRYAVTTLRADGDPAATLRGAVKRQPVKHKAALDRDEIARLLNRIHVCDASPAVVIALRLLLLTFVRPGELRCATWEEFDFDNAQWRIPATRMKMRKPHIVPLARQSLDLLTQLRALNQSTRLLFPNVRDSKRPMSPTTLNRCLERLGYGGIFSAHGFRATASTMLNELGYRHDVIERQLAHQERDQVRASYNHAQYLRDRTAMMQRWADLIDATPEVGGDAVIVPFKQSRSA